MCIDLIGPYSGTDQKDHDRILNTMTFVDPATGWFEITEIPDKTSARISQIFNTNWLSRYPRPRNVLFLTMEMSLRKISYLSLGTSVSNPLLQ